jgi:hypothetical protein
VSPITAGQSKQAEDSSPTRRAKRHWDSNGETFAAYAPNLAAAVISAHGAAAEKGFPPRFPSLQGHHPVPGSSRGTARNSRCHLDLRQVPEVLGRAAITRRMDADGRVVGTQAGGDCRGVHAAKDVELVGDSGRLPPLGDQVLAVALDALDGGLASTAWSAHQLTHAASWLL